MTYNPASDKILQQNFDLFQSACEEYAFKGSYPVFSDDPQEQKDLDWIHYRLERNLRNARKRIERLISRRLSQ